MTITIPYSEDAFARHVAAMYRCAGIAWSRGQTSYAAETGALADTLSESITWDSNELSRARAYWESRER